MGRLLAIDYGRKRCGIAVTDTLHICANGLPTVRSCDLMTFLKAYCKENIIDSFIIGEPRQLNGEPSESMKYLQPFIHQLSKEFPDIPIIMHDERFTSTIAHRELNLGGFKKKDREEKGKADQMAAVIILTSYLESRK